MKRTIGIGLFLLACLQGCATYVEMTLSSRAHSGITYTGVEEVVKEAGGQIRQFCMPYLEGCTGYIYAPDNLELESYEFDFSVVASNDTLTYDLTLDRDQVPEVHRGTMILLHGYGGSKEAMLWLANYYRFLGFHVIVPDLKGHGASTHDEPGFGVEDVDVLLALIDSLPARERPHPLYISGYSMGAVAAVHLAKQRNDISGIVLFGPMRQFEDAAAEVAKMSFRRLSKIIGDDSVREGVRNTLAKRGIDARELDIHQLLEDFRVPTLIIASNADPVAPYDYYMPLQSSSVTIKELPQRHHFLLTIINGELHDIIYPWLNQQRQ